jgi:glycosyltransferase involved in cell wall biosynthesis
VTTCFNSEEYIEETIVSVLSQKGAFALQYIIIDACSTDGTLAKINKYKDHVSIIISEPDNGPAEALRKAFNLAHGYWLGWLNSDDILLPGALATVSEAMVLAPHKRWVTASRVIMRADGSFTKPDGLWYIDSMQRIMKDPIYLPQESTFFSRSLYSLVGGINPALKSLFDYDLFARMYAIEHPLYINAILGAFRRVPNQICYREDLAFNDRLILKSRTYGMKPLLKRLIERLMNTRFNAFLKYIFLLLLKSPLANATAEMQVMDYDSANDRWRICAYRSWNP